MSSWAKTWTSHPRSTHFGQWTPNWEICIISLRTGEPFPEYHCIQYPEYLASHRRPSLSTSTAPSSRPCLNFPHSNHDPLVVPPNTPCFSCSVLFMLFPLTAVPSSHSSFPKSSSKWLQFTLHCSVQTGTFSSGKLPLKSHWPGDSSRIERRVKNGEKDVSLLHISPLAKGTVRIRIPLFIFQRLSIFRCKTCWTKGNFKEVLFSPINGFPRWENSDCLIAVPLALVWTQITRSLLSGSLLSLSLIEVKFTYIKFAIVKCTIQWLEYIHNVVHITFI